MNIILDTDAPMHDSQRVTRHNVAQLARAEAKLLASTLELAARWREMGDESRARYEYACARRLRRSIRLRANRLIAAGAAR